MRIFLPLAAACLFTAAHAGSLDRADQVDLIELDGKTSQARLLVLLEEDRVNTRPAMKSLFKKVNNYLAFVDSGQLKEAAPTANPSLRPRIVVHGPKEASTAEMPNLAGLKLAGQKAGVEVEVLAYQPGIRPRPVAIKPGK
ncbi:DUF6572 domain-containing protein [Roseateles sp. NT4]|uniref:DUF6572 domain-containing protein n=1 Tax=Roseateles sp. NT4 TaxID=3453715 RepID=UPI003EEAE7D4